MEIIERGIADNRNVMWRNYRAHPIPSYSDKIYELDFHFKKKIDPELALEKISSWHQRFEKDIETTGAEKGEPSSMLFVCNEHDMFREYGEFSADFRGVLTFLIGDASLVMREYFPEVRPVGFRVSYRAIPLALYASVYEAQGAWLQSEQAKAVEALNAQD